MKNEIKFPTQLVQLALLAGLYLAFVTPAFAFSKLYVFGDSLSDQGNVSVLSGGALPPHEYTDGATVGRFTNGRNYVDYLAKDFGLTVAPSLLGGTNYAYGGARTNSPTGSLLLGLGQQRDAYLTRLGSSAADANALYIVWAGANDIQDILQNLQANPSYDPTQALTNTGANLGNVIGSLAAAGARSIVVPNIPDLGLIPSVTGGGNPNLSVSGLVSSFNSGLEEILQGLERAYPATEIIRIDAFSQLDTLYYNGAAFGLSNVSDGCYSLYIQAGGASCADPDAYLFWDADHPTTAVHRILASNVLSAVPEPANVLLMGAGLMMVMLASQRRLGSARRG